MREIKKKIRKEKHINLLLFYLMCLGRKKEIVEVSIDSVSINLMLVGENALLKERK